MGSTNESALFHSRGAKLAFLKSAFSASRIRIFNCIQKPTENAETYANALKEIAKKELRNITPEVRNRQIVSQLTLSALEFSCYSRRNIYPCLRNMRYLFNIYATMYVQYGVFIARKMTVSMVGEAIENDQRTQLSYS